MYRLQRKLDLNLCDCLVLGNPKGAILTHEAFIADIAGSVEVIQVNFMIKQIVG